MSLPFLSKKPIDLPPIVSIELIQITEKTNIPFAPKAKKIIEKVKEKEKKLVSEQAPPKKVKKDKPDAVPMPDDDLKKVDIAIRDLSFSDKRISKDVKKTISSAVSNAENNYQYDIDNLIVKEAYCGKQIIMKRFRARAKGRASQIIKPYSNVTIILTEKIKQTESHGSKG